MISGSIDARMRDMALRKAVGTIEMRHWGYDETYNSVASSLPVASSPSDEPAVLGTLDGGLELFRDGGREPGRDPPGEPRGEEAKDADSRRCRALRDKVLPLSRACLRRLLCMMPAACKRVEEKVMAIGKYVF